MLFRSDEKGNIGNKEYKTKDLVYLDSSEGFYDMDNCYKKCEASDYAIMNGGQVKIIGGGVRPESYFFL